MTGQTRVLCGVFFVIFATVMGCSGDENGSSTDVSSLNQGEASETSNAGGADTDLEQNVEGDRLSSMMPELPLPDCVTNRLGGALPATVDGTTTSGMDTFASAPCATDATGASADFAAFFVAPEAGEYIFTSEGSDFDTVMHIADAEDASCSGIVLACNDDDPMGKET